MPPESSDNPEAPNTVLRTPMSSQQTDRYHRQRLIPSIGDRGQEKLNKTSALLVGCGALGTVIADQLVRAGIGRLVIVDRDVVELTNLQRQVLFDERDVETAQPKAIAAKARLQQINRAVCIEAHVDDFNARNGERLCQGIDLFLDGLDNFETRYLLNDLAVMRGLPYVYGGAVGTGGMSMVILPHAMHTRKVTDAARRIHWDNEQAGPCLRCLFPVPPPAGTSATCDTVGVLASIVNIIASHQTLQAIKLITGNIDALDRSLLSYDGWSNTWQRFDVRGSASTSCPCCRHGEFAYLQGNQTSTTTSLCGRDAVQIIPANNRTDMTKPHRLDLRAIAERLSAHGSFVTNDSLLRGTFSREQNHQGRSVELTLFPDGRAILHSVDEPDQARAIYSRYIGD